MHRFYLPASAPQLAQTIDLAPLARQLTRVLRLAPGAQITLFNGDGWDYTVELLDLTPAGATGAVRARRRATTEVPVKLTLYQCSLKGDKFEWVLQKGTELGVARFVPVISARSIVRPAAALRKKFPRWRSILQEATEQSGRTSLPGLEEPLTLEQAIAAGGGLRLLPAEAAAQDPAAPTLLESMRTAEEIPHVQRTGAASDISLLIGPEGGFAPAEVDAAEEAGWTLVSLGPRILRAETAAVAAVAIIIAQIDRAASP